MFYIHLSFFSKEVYDMKKILFPLVLLLTLVLVVLAAAGCRDGGGNTETEPSATEAPTSPESDADSTPESDADSTPDTAIPSESDTESEPETKPAAHTVLYDLRTEDMVEPIGVDVAAPTFSWKMNSAVLGQHQTAYRIEIAADDGTVLWDSGKTAGGESVDIVYGGDPLSPSTRYRWDLTVWDKNDEAFAETTHFETGLMGQAGFAGADWISYGTMPIAQTDHYTIDMDFVLLSGNIGICFAAQNDKNMLMWQINTVDTNGVKLLLRPHVMQKGTWSTFNGNIDITAASGLSNGRDIIGKSMHLRMEVEGKTVTTYLSPVGETLKQVDRQTVTYNTDLHTIGFRLAASANERAKVDTIVIRDADGAVLYENDFSAGTVEDFSVSGGSAQVQNGYLTFTHSGTGDLVALRADAATAGLPVFRKAFTPKGEIVSAKLYTSGLGVYESYINGARVGKLLSNGTVEYHELKPGSAEAADRKYYSAYDVTHMFKDITGEAVLSATMGTGWWTGEIAAYHGSSEAYLAKLILTYADGTKEVINTDTSWQVGHASPFLYSDIFGGEDYDARVDTSWMLPGYDAEASGKNWAPAVINTEFEGEITAWMGSTIQVRKDLQRDVQSVTVYKGAKEATANRYGVINVLATYEDGSFTLNPGETALVDFGQNAAGWEAFTVQGEAGTVLRIEHGEMLNDQKGEHRRGNDGPGGSLYNANNRSARAATVYTLRGGEPESYHPSLTYYGFRYIEITTTKTVTFTKITGEVVTSVDTDTGWLETSDAKVNQLISNIRWGQYSNYLSVPTDCPQRNERLGWMADTQVFARAGAYFGFSKSFLEKYMQDVRDTQNDQGAYPGIAPGDFVDGAGWGGTGWADAGIIVPYTLYEMFGDVQVIRDNWESMTQYMSYLQRTNGPHNIWGDWLAYESNDTEIQNLLSDAYYAWDCLMMAEMAEVIGEKQMAEKYTSLYERAVTAFRNAHVKADGTMKRGEQVACLYALYLDLLPDEASVTAVTNQLIENIERNGNRLQTGFLGTKIIMETLTKIGRSDVAYTLLLQTDNPSWLYSVDQGATAIWERWNSYTVLTGFGDVNMNSFNHYAYGAVANWMFSTMAGIDTHPDAVGFKKLLIAPVPDSRIGEVMATYNSAYGAVTTNSVFDGKTWEFSVVLPANTTAEMRLPVAEFSTITVNGKALDTLTEAADGIAYVGTEDGVAVFQLVAGTFTVECK